MSEARDAIEAGVRALNTGDMEGFLANYTHDATLWLAGMPAEAKGKDQIRQAVQIYFTAFPGFQLTVKVLIESADWVAAEHHFTGTNTGPSMTPSGEIPATGKTVELMSADIFEFRGAKIIAQRTYFDNLALMTQLGLMPASSTAST